MYTHIFKKKEDGLCSQKEFLLAISFITYYLRDIYS